MTQPTPITGFTSIDYMNSPKHVYMGYSAGGDSNLDDLNITSTQPFNSIKLEIWVWSGDLNTPYTAATAPTFTIEKTLVSSVDTAIIVEISDYVKPFINPRVLFNYPIQIFDECIYYQFQVTFYDENGLEVDFKTPKTRLATLGYNWYWEGEETFNFNKGSFGYSNTYNPADRYYYPLIDYTQIQINLSGATSSFDMINRLPFIPSANQVKCTDMPAIIIFLNKQGLFDVFNITGDIQVNTSIERETYKRGSRNPLGTDRFQFHSTREYNNKSVDSFIINTGLITEKMGELVEEILNSQQVYLILFEEGLTPADPVTVDNTFITVDNTLITVDRTGYGASTRYRQIPVNVTSSDFARKNRIRDKANIAYTFELTDSNQKINSIRG